VKASYRFVKGGKLRGSPVAMPTFLPVSGSTPLLRVTSRIFGDVEVAGEDIGLLAEGAGLDAAAGPPSRASSTLLPTRTCSMTTASVLKTEG
jgi:hypothetical protein